LITLFFLPETQGLTLEELDVLFHKAPYIVWFGIYKIDSSHSTRDTLSTQINDMTEDEKANGRWHEKE